MSKSSDWGWWTCEGWQPCNCLRIPKARRFQESRMPGNPLVRFDEGRVGRTCKVSPSLLLYHWFDKLFHRADGPAQWAGAKMVRYADDFVVLARYQGTRLTGWIESKLEGWL